MKNYPENRNKEKTELAQVSVAAADFTLTGFSKISEADKIDHWRIIVDDVASEKWNVLGADTEYKFLNTLQAPYWAAGCLKWLRGENVELRSTNLNRGKEFIIHRNAAAISGVYQPSLLSAAGMGVAPHRGVFEEAVTMSPEQAQQQYEVFDSVWSDSPKLKSKTGLEQQLEFLSSPHPAEWVYMKACQIFVPDSDVPANLLDDPPGYTESLIWKKLFKFQKDGVKGAINKILKYNGCVLADSVGLGKTFEALAVIKYFADKGDKVLVLAPKRLRANWSVYTQQDKRNLFKDDPFRFTLLNHTDVGRKSGKSGSVDDLSHFMWDRFDLVVIDESHNFRNHKGSRYQTLLEEVIKKGAKTKLLLLTATPVNNRVTDLRNQINLIAHGEDNHLANDGIISISETTRQAQGKYAAWARTPETERVDASLLRVLGQDYLHLLDMLTIARSRKHIETHYNSSENENHFPARRKPINCYPSVGDDGFLPVLEISKIMRSLNMAVYCPLHYILQTPAIIKKYADKYNQQIGENNEFSQQDREKSLTALITVNLLKRMESSIEAFSITLDKQIKTTEETMILLKSGKDSDMTDGVDSTIVSEGDDDVDGWIGKKVKVSPKDVDVIRMQADLADDLAKLQQMQKMITKVIQSGDSKMSQLKRLIDEKMNSPINQGNRKIIIFTAFADTADYIYNELADWLLQEYKVYTAKVTGSRANEVNMPGIRKDQDTLLSVFSPLSKEFDLENTNGKEIDVLIATDCVSEGQNLQDCDYLVNFDIHWNPVRLIQRFGRIDRIGSKNTEIQMVNMWPIKELDKYINLEQRVRDKMGLLDVNATGHDNLLNAQADGQDLDFRAKQLLRLKEEVICMEDVVGDASLTELNLQQSRSDLQNFRLNAQTNSPEAWPSYLGSVTSSSAGVPAGAFFLLKSYASIDSDKSYPYAPYYLFHVDEKGVVAPKYRDIKEMLAMLQTAVLNRNEVVDREQKQFDKFTRNGQDMTRYTKLLSAAVSVLIGEEKESVARSFFSAGKSMIGRGYTALGVDDVEVITWLAVLP